MSAKIKIILGVIVAIAAILLLVFSSTPKDTNKASLIQSTIQSTKPPPIKATAPNCLPRPACLDMRPACKMKEPETGWCPPSPAPTLDPAGVRE